MADFVIIDGNGNLKHINIYGSYGTAEGTVDHQASTTIQTTSAITTHARQSKNLSSQIQTTSSIQPVAMQEFVVSTITTTSTSTSNNQRIRPVDSDIQTISANTNTNTRERLIEGSLQAISSFSPSATQEKLIESVIDTELSPIPTALDGSLASYSTLGTSSLSSAIVSINKGLTTTINTTSDKTGTITRAFGGNTDIQTTSSISIAVLTKSQNSVVVMDTLLTGTITPPYYLVTASGDAITQTNGTITNNKSAESSITTTGDIGGELGNYIFAEGTINTTSQTQASAGVLMGLSVISYGADISKSVSLPVVGFYHSAFAVSTNTFAVVATFHGGDLYKTTDGGNNWGPLNRPSSMPTNNGLRYVAVYDNNNITISYADVLYYTIDGGQTWNSLSVPGLHEFRTKYISQNEILYVNTTKIFSLDPSTGIVTEGNSIPNASALYPLSLTEFYRSHSNTANIDYSNDGGQTWTTLYTGSGEVLNAGAIIGNRLVSVRSNNDIVVAENGSIISITPNLFVRTGTKFKYVDGRGNFIVVGSKGYQSGSSTFPAEYIVSEDGGSTWTVQGPINGETTTLSISVGGQNHFLSTGIGAKSINIKHKEVNPYINLESEVVSSAIVPYIVDTTIQTTTQTDFTAFANYVEDSQIDTILTIDNTPTYITQVTSDIDTSLTTTATPKTTTYVYSNIQTNTDVVGNAVVFREIDTNISTVADIQGTANRRSSASTTILTNSYINARAIRYLISDAFPILTTGVLTANPASRLSGETLIDTKLTFAEPILLGDLATESFAILTELSEFDVSATLNIPVTTNIQTQSNLDIQWSATLYSKTNIVSTGTLNNKVNRNRPVDTQINTSLSIIKAEALTSLRTEILTNSTVETRATSILHSFTNINSVSVTNKRRNIRIRYVTPDIQITSQTTGTLSTLQQVESNITTTSNIYHAYLTVGKAFSADIHTLSFQPVYYKPIIERWGLVDIQTVGELLPINTTVSGNATATIDTESSVDARTSGHVAVETNIETRTIETTIDSSVFRNVNEDIVVNSDLFTNLTTTIYLGADITTTSTFDDSGIDNAITINALITTTSELTSTIDIVSGVYTRTTITTNASMVADNEKTMNQHIDIVATASSIIDDIRIRKVGTGINTFGDLTAPADETTNISNQIDTNSETSGDNDRIRYIKTQIINTSSSVSVATKTSELCARFHVTAESGLSAKPSQEKRLTGDMVVDLVFGMSYDVWTGLRAEIASTSTVSTLNDISFVASGTIHLSGWLTTDTPTRIKGSYTNIHLTTTTRGEVNKTSGLCLNSTIVTGSSAGGRINKGILVESPITTKTNTGNTIEITTNILIESTTYVNTDLSVKEQPLTIRYIGGGITTVSELRHITGHALTLDAELVTIPTMSTPMLLELGELERFVPDRDRIVRVFEYEDRVIKVE